MQMYSSDLGQKTKSPPNAKIEERYSKPRSLDVASKRKNRALATAQRSDLQNEKTREIAEHISMQPKGNVMYSAACFKVPPIMVQFGYSFLSVPSYNT